MPHRPSEPDLFDDLEPPPQEAPPRNHRLAEIAVEGPVSGTFTYIAGDFIGRLVKGSRVLVPFGRRSAVGFFLAERDPEEAQRSGLNFKRLRPIEKVLETSQQPLLTPTLFELAQWIARHYAAPLGSTLSAMLPAGVKRGAFAARIRIVNATKPPDELLREAHALLGKKPKQAAILMALAASAGPIGAAELLHEAEASDQALRSIEKAGFAAITEQRLEDNYSAEKENAESRHDLPLNAEQQAALEKIETALAANAYRGFLLQGVTGSGKTEVYLRALKTALEQKKQAIVLVPEIALTPQTAQRFQSRLGYGRVAILHSHITDGERAEAWRAVREGQLDVVIGARSALFAPLPRLGVIVIDEEHENAFKQESTPRYHARDTAMELARLTNSVLIFGSATPSFEAYHAARTGKITHLFLNERVAFRPMPPVEIVDMTQENKETRRFTYLSRRLVELLDRTLARGEQSILFLNRRGFATVVTCIRCGHTEKCNQCDITLTSHKQSNQLVCHYCNYTQPIPAACSACGNPGLKHWGQGTERVEAQVLQHFPAARVARMDSDTMTRRTAYLEALSHFRAGKTDILVGTQMIAKGLDFPNVTLVGVVLADTALHMPDFRSRERTFQLLAQVAGRAGRGEKGGRVIVQTHLPANPAIVQAARHDFEAFASLELQERRDYNYPPYARLGRVIVRGQDERAAEAAAGAAGDAIRDAAAKLGLAGEIDILGPATAPIGRLESYFRHHILVKAGSSETLSRVFAAAQDCIAKLKGADAVIDVDPLSML